ncbi:hypothetical protein [Acetobacter orientalis]|uniref:hypothetical protein n=1 Tax=Acetobacter orientalis TaxID=146474 RepID=UPI00241EA5A6|nr:hypothetical protein [Acetobacter orientalis]
MNEGEALQYLEAHPELFKQFNEKHRMWISGISRNSVSVFTKILSEKFDCNIICSSLPPEWEFVFYDHTKDGNTHENFLEIALKRAQYLWKNS